MKVRHLLGLAVAAAIALVASSASAVDFNGYLRTGVGGNGAGGSQVCFALPGMPFKFRLGNECEMYGELGFGQNLYVSKETGLKFRYEGMLAVVTAQNQDYESLKADGNDIANRQNFVIATLPSGLQLWAGKRYYHRQDVHQIDFYYWDPSGYGAGVENIDVNFAKLAISMFQSNRGATRTDWRPDIRLEGINVGFGSLDVGFNGSYISSADPVGDAMEFSYGFTVQHKVGLLGGQNTLALQYGAGAMAQLDKYVSSGRTTDSTQFRVVWNLLFAPTEQWSGSFTTVFEDATQIYSNAVADEAQYWNSRQSLSVGLRPAYRFNDWFKFAGEAAYQSVMGKKGADDLSLYKITLAPTITTPAGPGGEFLTRPELRLFATYAGWNDKAKGQVGGDPFVDKTSGLTFGAQVEAWW